MIKVFTTGTFDVLHIGHINLLRQAKEMGDYLIVGVNLTKNGNPTFYSIEDRVSMLKSIKYVDEVVVLNEQEDKYKYLIECDIFAIGSDYIGFSDIEEISKFIEVRFIDRTPGVCSTDTKKYLSDSEVYNTFVIDIDDTIMRVTNRDFVNAEPIQKTIDKINELHDKGWVIKLFTSRGQKSCSTTEQMYNKYYSVTKDWLNKHGVKYHDIIFGKPNADYYVDDKNMSLEKFYNFEA